MGGIFNLEDNFTHATCLSCKETETETKLTNSHGNHVPILYCYNSQNSSKMPVLAKHPINIASLIVIYSKIHPIGNQWKSRKNVRKPRKFRL